jgi:hypothetical protein
MLANLGTRVAIKVKKAGVNFTNLLRTDFSSIDPKRAKRH